MIGANTKKKEFALLSDFSIELDFTSSTSLTSQLEVQLRRSIARMSTGEKLNPERLLAEQLGVSRVTIRNAVNSLVKEGLLVRCGRHGTMVAERKKTVQVLPVNDLAFGNPSFHPTVPLRFLYYETLPRQLEFWQEVFRRFNASYSHCQIVPEYLPANVSAADFKQYLIQSGADLFQFNYGQNAYSMAQPLPDALQEKMRSGDFFYDRIPESEQKYLTHLMPINSTMFRTYCNTAHAKQYGISLPFESADYKVDLFSFLLNSAEALPETITAGGRIWDYARHEILRHPGTMQEALTQFCQKHTPAIGKKNLFLLEEEKPLDSIQKLFSGEVFSLSISTPHFQALTNENKLDFASGLMNPAAHVPCTAMGIARNSLFQNEAALFLEFLLSEEIQSLAATLKQAVPMHRKIWYEYAATEKMTRTEADQYITAGLFLSDDNHNPLLIKSNFLTFCLRQEWADFCRGKNSAKDTVLKILAKWQLFCKGFQASPN